MPTACGSHPEYFLRPAPLDIFRRKEAREVKTDDLFAPVTFNSFGTGIPTNHRSPWVQHENRVVLDLVEEHPIFFFAVPEGLLCHVLGCGNLRRDLTEFVFQ